MHKMILIQASFFILFSYALESPKFGPLHVLPFVGQFGYVYIVTFHWKPRFSFKGDLLFGAWNKMYTIHIFTVEDLAKSSLYMGIALAEAAAMGPRG